MKCNTAKLMDLHLLYYRDAEICQSVDYQELYKI